MSLLHYNTTVTPTKTELLTAWLPTRPWYTSTGAAPELTKAGGFRLDDPQGEVGIEFMVAMDASGDRPRAYHVPLTYRGAPLDGAADQALIGTMEHGVLGKRWVYDGTHDPVLVAELLAFVQGRVPAHAQSVTGALDPSVAGRFTGAAIPTSGPAGSSVAGSATVTDGPHGTDVVVTRPDGGGPLTVHVVRALRPEEPSGTQDAAAGHITAGWRLPDGTTVRGRYTVLGEATG